MGSDHAWHTPRICIPDANTIKGKEEARTEGLLGALELLALLAVEKDEGERLVEVQADPLHQLLLFGFHLGLGGCGSPGITTSIRTRICK